MGKYMAVGGRLHGQIHDREGNYLTIAVPYIPVADSYIGQLFGIGTPMAKYKKYYRETVSIPTPAPGEPALVTIWLYEDIRKDDAAPMVLDAMLRNIPGVHFVPKVAGRY